MFEIKADKRSYLRVKEQFELLKLDKKARVRVLKELGKYITKDTKKNIRAQRDPDGKPWAKRKKGRRKMLRGFTQKLKHFQKDNNRVLVVGWPSRRGTVALAHHTGEAEHSGLNQRFKQAKKKKEPKKTDPATREQARELRDLGYRLAPQGRQKRGKQPTLKFITQNMTVAQAAKLISELENKTSARKWEVDRPERRLIGISPKRAAMIIKRELNRNRS
ncbi:Phage virion morphogenesis protein [Vibrio coralliirubri]|uniref:phage virion morphogenesis protein n=1 Tax=Vibrio coralliirubri TaxID=1516159 RepID=UPI000636C15C|nr:phage virion morphogenesis protein [Vibrio coralliirubri]CDT98581.1 Phage virion morphogenesis protein [Vibrio coralliirubri]